MERYKNLEELASEVILALVMARFPKPKAHNWMMQVRVLPGAQMKKWLALFLALALVSCNQNTPKVPQTNPTVLFASEVINAMVSCGVDPSLCEVVTDVKYMLPSENWFLGKFPGLLRDFQSDLRQTSYVEAENDCDDFARMASGFAKILHNNTKKVKGTSLAVGEFYYFSDRLQVFHAINFALVKDDDGRFKVLFIEPQTGEILNLSKHEKETCRNWLL